MAQDERFDRTQFDGWSHEEMVDAYVGANFYAKCLEAEVARLKALLEDEVTE